MDVFRGAFNGRFYQLDAEAPLGVKLLQKAQPQAWGPLPPGTPHQRWRLGWSGPAPEAIGDLVDVQDDEGSCWVLEDNLARMWLRVDEKHVPKAALSRAIRAEALRRYGTPIGRVPSREREALEAGVTMDLRARAILKVRVFEVLLRGDGLLWMAKPPSDEGVRTRIDRLLATTFGPTLPHPMIWKPEDLQWFTYSMAVLMQLRHGVTQLSPSVSIEEVRLKRSDFQLRTSADTELYLPMLRALLDSDQIPDVTLVGLQVMMNGEPTILRFGPEGLSWASPPLSTGGLLAERVLRRLDDVDTACELVREALEAAMEAVRVRALSAAS